MKRVLLFLLFLPMTLLANTDEWQKRWWGVHSIVDLHKHYKLNEPILEPADSVQALMGLVYYGESFKIYKDCLGYEVPVNGDVGKIFVVTTSVKETCESVIMSEKRDGEFKAKSLSFNLNSHTLGVMFSDEKFRSKEIFFNLPNLDRQKAESYYARSVIILAPDKEGIKQPHPIGKISDSWNTKKLKNCQTADEECNLGTFNCNDCRFGYFEVQNGCLNGGPKYCGIDQCGEKGFPACARGQLYQTGSAQKKMDCRVDPSFVFCKKGLRIRCQGSLAICD